MTTDTPVHDEIALPRFEDRLWAELAHEHRAQLAGMAGMADAADPPGPRHRRRVRRSFAAGLGAVAVAAAVFAAVIVQQPDRGSDRGEVTAEPDLATRIIAAMQEGAATSVVHVTQDNTTFGDSEMWTDETTGAFRSLQLDAEGSPSFDSGATSVPGEAGEQGPTRTVDHCFGEYTEGGSPALPVGPGSATRWVQNYLERGWLVEDGTEVVDGRELIRLKEVMPESGLTDAQTPAQEPADPDQTAAEAEAALERAQEEEAAVEQAEEQASESPTDGGGPTDDDLGYVLVDPETYRPVLNVGYPGSDAEYTQRFEYLPRSADNLAHLVAPVPDGFTRVDALRGDGERADAGCS